MRKDKAIKFFKLAEFQSNLFSKDPSKKVCALFIAPESLQILSAGYNGFCRGITETNLERWERPEKYKYVVHAEANGIYNACRNGVSLKDSICIVTFFPCSNCTKGLIQVGISKLISIKPDFNHERWGEDFKYSFEMLSEVKIEIMFLDPHEIF
jgi:dCMP deaminase